ncbi:MAG: hypothetical protein ACREXR_12830 [Gammaproteobacteria bacterium]
MFSQILGYAKEVLDDLTGAYPTQVCEGEEDHEENGHQLLG